jgi:hypothetical protein
MVTQAGVASTTFAVWDGVTTVPLGGGNSLAADKYVTTLSLVFAIMAVGVSSGGALTWKGQAK